MSPRGSDRLEGRRAPLHRDRRRRHERPRPGRPPARRRGDRLRPRGVLLHGAAARGRAGALDRPRRRAGPRGRRGGGLHGDRRRQPRARPRARAGPDACSTAASCSPSSARSAACWRSPVPTARPRRRRWCVHALREAGADPAFFLGGELPGAGPDGAAANAGWGEGEWVVAEADESDASFLELRPEVAVITNLELDHHSRWSSLAELTEAFARFSAPAGAGAVAAEVELPAAEAADRLIRFALEPAAGAGPPRDADLLASGDRGHGAAAASRFHRRRRGHGRRRGARRSGPPQRRQRPRRRSRRCCWPAPTRTPPRAPSAASAASRGGWS